VVQEVSCGGVFVHDALWGDFVFGTTERSQGIVRWFSTSVGCTCGAYGSSVSTHDRKQPRWACPPSRQRVCADDRRPSRDPSKEGVVPSLAGSPNGGSKC
jgi:hypothetical protein